MIEAFKPLPIANENAIVDRFGAPLNVGNYVAFGEGNHVSHGRIIGYNWLYFQVAYTMMVVDQQTQQSSVKAFQCQSTAGFPYNSLLNIDKLITAGQRDLEDPLYAPLLNFSTSETKKVARKYVVCLLADTNQPSTSSFVDYQICITSIAGSTAAEIALFTEHLKEVYGKRIVTQLAGARSRNFVAGYAYSSQTRNSGKHNWNIGTIMYGNQTTPQIETYYLTQAETQLSKRRIQEIGLMDHMDTIMSVTDYNNLDIEEVSKLELML